MRYLIFLAAVFFASSAVSTEWRSLPLAQLEFALQLPTDYAIESETAEATVVRNPAGTSITIFRANIEGDRFEATVDELIVDEVRSWSIGGRTVTPDWATYWAANGRWHLLVHLFRPCGDARVIGVRIERPITTELDQDRVTRSVETAAGQQTCR